MDRHNPYEETRSRDFSIICAVYNTAEYIDEAVESVISQTVGIDSIELILVNDASTDNSLDICRKWEARYPDSIKVINQEKNQGVSAARNAGLRVARGRYINFLDSDDKLLPDTCQKVEEFFIASNSTLFDVVALPIIFFDGESGAHPLNNKFEGGSRIIDLDKEWYYAQNFISSVFVRKNALDGIWFDERMPMSEDLKFVQELLLRTHKLGVLSNTHYLYRRRTGNNLSAIQTKEKKKVWYIPTLRNGLLDLVNKAKAQNSVPRYLQFLIAYEMQWRLRMRDIECTEMSAHERKEYYKLIHQLLQYVDNDIIDFQKSISTETKAYAKLLKKGWPIDIILFCRNTRLLKLIKYII